MSRYPRWGWAPYLLLGLVVGAWALTHVGAVASGATSVRAWGFAMGAGALTGLLLVGVARLTGRGWAGQLAGLVPLLAASVVAVLPSYLPSDVDEAAPDGLLVIMESGTGPASTPAPSTAAPSTAAPSGSASVPPPRTSPPPAVTTQPTAPPTTEQPTTEQQATAPPTVPVQLGVADFVGIDHDVSGTASLIRLPDGELLVRFEAFTVEPGPDYDVYVAAGPDVQVPDGTHLGNLEGTRGDQNYELAADAVATPGTVTVLIWCELFDVPVANATLQT